MAADGGVLSDLSPKLLRFERRRDRRLGRHHGESLIISIRSDATPFGSTQFLSHLLGMRAMTWLIFTNRPAIRDERRFEESFHGGP